MKTLIIGNGKWSKTLQRVLTELKKDFIVTTHDWQSQVDQVNKAIIATPAPTHFSIANELLRFKISTLIEKPAVLTLEHAEILEHHSNLTGTPLFCHTPYLYHDLILQLKKDILPCSYINYSSYRANMEGNHRDGNSFVNHGAHDLSILWELGIREDIKVHKIMNFNNLITVESSNSQGNFNFITGELQPVKTRYIAVNDGLLETDLQIIDDKHYLKNAFIHPEIRSVSEPLKSSLSDFIDNTNAKCGIEFIKWSAKIFEQVRGT